LVYIQVFLPAAYESAPQDPGLFVISAENIPLADLTVQYRVSGTASNGVDYELLTGTATISPDLGSTNLYVYPKVDNLAEGFETVTLTLIPGTNYLVAPQDSHDIDIRFDNHGERQHFDCRCN
jgi:hypothetical protein